VQFLVLNDELGGCYKRIKSGFRKNGLVWRVVKRSRLNKLVIFTFRKGEKNDFFLEKK